jgi:hypothetical protein
MSDNNNHTTTTTTTTTERALFGGAVSCALPSDFLDISDLRQVPDNQECFQGPSGHLLVIEILERQNDVSDETAVEYFFNDLAQSNGCEEDWNRIFHPGSVLTSSSSSSSSSNCICQGLPPEATVCQGSGQQKVAVGRDTDVTGNPRRTQQQQVHDIRVELCVIRLPMQSTDVIITLSTPTIMPTSNDEISFVQILSSFQIRDWSLFS